jgi:hypothetical protein
MLRCSQTRNSAAGAAGETDMATTIGFPPGKTKCDWCHKAVEWKDTDFTHDNEALCPKCWPTWLGIIGASNEELAR